MLFFRNPRKPAPIPESVRNLTEGPYRTDCGDGCYFTYDEYSNSLGGYHAGKLVFHNPSAGIVRWITDRQGNFLDFPGYKQGPWMKNVNYSLEEHRIRFAHRIGAFKNGKLTFYWTFQPDGRYYEDDDGFGITHDVEIQLVSTMNRKGEFLQPFHQESHQYRQAHGRG